MSMTPPKKRSKRIPRAQADAVARNVKAWIDREHGGVQRAAERATGISQAHLSALLRPEDRRGPGLEVLLRLRQVMHMTIDEILGLPPLGRVAPRPTQEPGPAAPPSAPSEEVTKAEVRRFLLELVKSAQEPDGDDPPPSRPNVKS